MTHKCKFLCILVIGMFGLTSASADIMVTLSPAELEIGPPVGSTGIVEIFASIPEADAILGWGLDFSVDVGPIAEVTNVAIGPLFNAVATPDGDGLGGLAFPDCVFGENVLLATLELTGLVAGESPLYTGATEGDLTEGFALCGQGFAEVVWGGGFLTVVPEPASLALLAVGLLALRRR